MTPCDYASAWGGRYRWYLRTWTGNTFTPTATADQVDRCHENLCLPLDHFGFLTWRALRPFFLCGVAHYYLGFNPPNEAFSVSVRSVFNPQSWLPAHRLVERSFDRSRACRRMAREARRLRSLFMREQRCRRRGSRVRSGLHAARLDAAVERWCNQAVLAGLPVCSNGLQVSVFRSWLRSHPVLPYLVVYLSSRPNNPFGACTPFVSVRTMRIA